MTTHYTPVFRFISSAPSHCCALATICLMLVVLLLPCPTVEAQVLIQRGDSSVENQLIAKQANKIRKQVLKVWKKQNKSLPSNLRESVINQAKVQTIVPRYAAEFDQDSALIVSLTQNPVGYVDVAYDGQIIGRAAVNEANGLQVEAFTFTNANGSLTPTTDLTVSQNIAQKLADPSLSKAVVMGIDQASKILIGQQTDQADGRAAFSNIQSVDIQTAQVSAYDIATLPSYAIHQERRYGPGVVIGSVAGGCAVIAILLITLL